MLAKQPPGALVHLKEARKRLDQANALAKRPNILSTKVRALGALKIFRAMARKSGDYGGNFTSLDASFKEEITFERLLQDLITQSHNVSKEVEALARAAIAEGVFVGVCMCMYMCIDTCIFICIGMYISIYICFYTCRYMYE